MLSFLFLSTLELPFLVSSYIFVMLCLLVLVISLLMLIVSRLIKGIYVIVEGVVVEIRLEADTDGVGAVLFRCGDGINFKS